MRTSLSVVRLVDEEANELMRTECRRAADAGGSFTIRTHYQPSSGWFNEYVILYADEPVPEV